MERLTLVWARSLFIIGKIPARTSPPIKPPKWPKTPTLGIRKEYIRFITTTETKDAPKDLRISSFL